MADDQPAANPHRGEISITLGGSSYVLLPSFEAAAAIDEAVGGVLALFRRVYRDPASITLAELAIVITEGIRAKGREEKSANANAGQEKVKRMIFEAGLPVAVDPAIAMLTAIVTGGAKGDGPSAEGKA